MTGHSQCSFAFALSAPTSQLIPNTLLPFAFLEVYHRVWYEATVPSTRNGSYACSLHVMAVCIRLVDCSVRMASGVLWEACKHVGLVPRVGDPPAGLH